MKNIFKLVTAALGVFCLASCGENVSKTNEQSFSGVGYQERDYVAIKDLNKHIVVGKKDQITLDTLPQNFNSKIVYESKDTSVVTVSDSGELTAIARGKTRVLVKTSEGVLIGKVNVIVSDGTNKDVVSTISSINAVYNDSSYAPKTKAYKREYSYETYLQNGAPHHSYSSFEEIAFDAENCYFMVSSDDLQTYTLNGAREISSGKWIFQVQGMKLRMVHITDTIKSFLDVNIAFDRYDNPLIAMYDVLDMFFVSGREVATDVLDDYSGKEDFLSFATSYGKAGYSFNADGNNNLFIGYKASTNGTVSISDELDYLDIPTDTTYKNNIDYRFLYDGASCSGYTIQAVYDYKLDDVPWKRDFMRSCVLDGDFEVEEYKAKPEDMVLQGWTQARTLYDL